MIAWMTLCPSPPPVSFESGHAKLGLTQPFLSLAIGHYWEQHLIALIFVTSPCHSRLPITTSPIQIRKVTWNFFICELQLWIIHLMPKTNPITSKIVDETLFKFGVYLVIRKINQLLCHLGDGGGSFLIDTLCKTSHDTFGWTMRLYMYMDRPLSDLK
jgi:hypothetical protein